MMQSIDRSKTSPENRRRDKRTDAAVETVETGVRDPLELAKPLYDADLGIVNATTATQTTPQGQASHNFQRLSRWKPDLNILPETETHGGVAARSLFGKLRGV